MRVFVQHLSHGLDGANRRRRVAGVAHTKRVSVAHRPVGELGGVLGRERRQHWVVRRHRHPRAAAEFVPDNTRVLVAEEHRLDGVGAVEDFVHDEERRAGGGLRLARRRDERFDAPNLGLEQGLAPAVVDRVQVAPQDAKRRPAHRLRARDPPRLGQQHVEEHRLEDRRLATGVGAREDDVLVERQVVACLMVGVEERVERLGELEGRSDSLGTLSVPNDLRHHERVALQQPRHRLRRIQHAHVADPPFARLPHARRPELAVRRQEAVGVGEDAVAGGRRVDPRHNGGHVGRGRGRRADAATHRLLYEPLRRRYPLGGLVHAPVDVGQQAVVAVAVVQHQRDVRHKQQPPHPLDDAHERHKHRPARAASARLVEPKGVLEDAAGHRPALAEGHLSAHPLEHHERQDDGHKGCEALDERRTYDTHMVVRVLRERHVVEGREHVTKEEMVEELGL